MCSAAVQVIWSTLDCSPPARGIWVAHSALAVEHVQFHWALAQITNHKKQRSGGLGLEQKEEPTAAWWSDHRLLVLWWGSFLKLLMLVVGGWRLGKVGGAEVETLFIKISGASTGVYVSLRCLCRMTGTKWNLRRRIRGNTDPDASSKGLLSCCFHLCD